MGAEQQPPARREPARVRARREREDGTLRDADVRQHVRRRRRLARRRRRSGAVVGRRRRYLAE